MHYVRPLSEAAFAPLGPTGPPGFEAAFVSQQESVMTLAARVGPGACGPGLHYHTSDQFYLILRGEASIQLGADEHTVPAVSLVFVPAGVAHRSWNSTETPEEHMELFVPAIGAGRPLLTPVEDVSQAPGSAVAPYVTRIDDDAFAANTRASGFGVQALADAGRGVTSCVINAVQVDPGGAGPELHIHAFDQLFLVLEGELHVDVALQRHVVAPHSLVVLPAGVPHTQWNEGPGREVHLAVLAPAPEPGRPLTIPVAFAPAAS